MEISEEKLLPPAPERKLLPQPPPAKPAAGRRVWWLAGAVLLALAALFLFGYVRHRNIESVAASEAERERNALPVVNVAKVRRAPANSELLLPGNIIPITEAYLYARASGYVRKRYADIGDRVRAGQLLAEIEAPDLDQQVAQGRAALAQSEEQLRQTRSAAESARSQMELARVTWDRYQVLVSHGAIARQDADQQYTAFQTATANYNSAQANIAGAQQNVSANRANLERLIALQGFEKVTAPFEGIITARNFDVGALISGGGSSLGSTSSFSGGTQNTGTAGNAGTSGTGSLVAPSGGGGGELFRIAQIGTLRILINVPQENAPTVQPGQAATVLVEQFSNEPFQGKITRTANAIDLNTRTLLTEVQVANARHILLPGMYAQVQLTNVRSNPPLLIPGDSIIVGAKGIEIAVLRDPQQNDLSEKPPPGSKQIHIQKIEVGRDYGPEIEVTRGLQGWEYVVVNPSDVVEEGAIVKAQNAPRTAGEGGQQRRGASDRQPSGIGAENPGAGDTGGRGASTKGGGQKK